MTMSLLSIQPNQEPFLFIGENIQITNSSIVCIHTYSEDEWFFKCHWPHFPTMPGSLQQEAMTQLGGILIFSQLTPRPSHLLLRSIEKSTFLLPISPGTNVIITASIASAKRGIYKFNASIASTEDKTIYSKCLFTLVNPLSF